MATYKRRNGRDTWHWCQNCSNYPTGADVDVKYTKPTSGEFCDECLGKEKANNCK